MTGINHLLRCSARVAGRTTDHLSVAVSAVAFWTAIVVPLSYLLFLVQGIRTQAQFTVFLGLIAVNYVALILGHSHNRSSES